jgi:dTDP-4-amino-4,6-dideoxygalactose transaminase
LVPTGNIGPRWPIHGEEELRKLQEVLKSEVWGATFLGPKIDELNRKWADYCGTERSVALANGTVTMELSLRALDIGPGDEVIVPAWTFMATASAVLQAGAIPVFVDIDPLNLCISPESVEEAINGRTRAMIPVHFGGHPCDMDRLTETARKHSLVMIEDAAQAHAAIWRGQKMGKFGACGSYSFQQSKNLQCGEGGSVVTDDADLADRLHFSLSKFGRGLNKDYEPFTHYELGGNACMTEFQAAIVLAQLSRLDEQADRRSLNASRLTTHLNGIDGIAPLPVDPRVDRHGYHLYLFRYDDHAFQGLPKELFAEGLTAEGIPCFPLYRRPLYCEPMYDVDKRRVRRSHLPVDFHPCPETERAAKTVLALPQTTLLADPRDLEIIPYAISKVRKHIEDLNALSTAGTVLR